MSNALQVILPTSEWAKSIKYKITDFMNNNGIHEDEIKFDMGELKKAVECVAWNYLIYGMKYKIKDDVWDTRHYLANMMIDDLIESGYDHDIEILVTHWVEEKLSQIIGGSNFLIGGWEMISFYSTNKDIVLRVGGDWRAAEWSRTHNLDYEW